MSRPTEHLPTHLPTELMPTDLSALETAYVWSINQAIEGDDGERAAELADDFQREADRRGQAARAVTLPAPRSAIRSRLLTSSRRYLTEVFNPPVHLAPRSHLRGPLGY